MILRVLNYLKGKIERSQQHQHREIILPLLWGVYHMETVTILHFKHQLRKPEDLLNVCFSFLLDTLLLEQMIYHFGRNYGVLLNNEWEGRTRWSVPSRSESLSMQWPCWGSAGKFYLRGAFLGNSRSPSQHLFLASFSGCSSTNLHRIKPIL